MSKDNSERRMYRKSPGRQYGYDYDPLRNAGQNGQGERTTRENTPGRISTQLVQRPDLRRTRQLTRKNILASKGRSAVEDEQAEQLEEEHQERYPEYEEQEDSTLYSHRRALRTGDLAQPHLPSTHQLMQDDEESYEDEAGEWQHYPEVDSDNDYEYPDPMDVRLGYAVVPPPRSASYQGTQEVPNRIPMRSRRLVEPEPEEYEDEDEEYEYEEEARPRRRKKKVSRRGLLIGLGAAAVSGAALYEIPRLPGQVSSATTNIEQQLHDAFQNGLAQGADSARRELLGTLENLEGFTLDGAIGAAKLTRVAYDVFVSPIIKFGANITGNFLSSMLQAVKTARGILSQSFLDTPMLQAIQKVLESWVNQVATLPKQLDAITDTDLNGAQEYLNALQNKIKEEQAKLSKSGSSATPSSKNK